MATQFVCPHCERLVPLTISGLEKDAVLLSCAKCGQVTRESVSLAAPVAAPPRDTRDPVPRAAEPASVLDSRPIALESSATASNVVSLRTASTEAIDRAARASRADPFEAPAGHCPKCIGKRVDGAASCPWCGLDFANYDPASMRPPDWLRDPWRELLLTWSNESEHAQVRAMAQKANGLPELGRLYRIRLADFADDPFAARARDELLRAATLAVSSRPAEPEEERTPGWKVALAIVGLGGAMAVSWYILRLALAAPPQ